MTLHLFDAYGIELEYMIVDARTLDVRPIADELLRAMAGGEAYEMEVSAGDTAWSNELALHVAELKLDGPAPSLGGLGALFHQQIARAGELLAEMDARLLPGGMHPWMDPHAELRLWSHDDDLIYRTFDRIFDCRGHGWANLQSMHINLPFSGDDELGRLHAAIRAVLPILPALAASSPIADGRVTGLVDTRLEVYRTNAARVPSVSGDVVPEPVYTRADYEREILARIYADLEPLDPDRVLRHEWANARGAITRFDRNAIEIRVLDTQECPRADVAVAGAVTAVVRALTTEPPPGLRALDQRALVARFRDTSRLGERAVIDDAGYLGLLGFPEARATAGDLWRHLIETVVALDPLYPEWQSPLALILERGPLARRILRATGETPSRARLAAVYGRVADCLRDDELLAGDEV